MIPSLSLVILKSGSSAAIAYGKYDHRNSSTMNGAMGPSARKLRCNGEAGTQERMEQLVMSDPVSSMQTSVT
jgi:hypothetical protein